MPTQVDVLRLDQLTADPSSPVEGDLWFRSDQSALKIQTDAGVKSLDGVTPSFVAASSSISTSSSTFSNVDSMSITPPAGTYLVWFTIDINASGNNNSGEIGLAVAGSDHTNSSRRFKRGGSGKEYRTGMSTMARLTVNGSQAITGRWRATSGTVNGFRRRLQTLKVRT